MDTGIHLEKAQRRNGQYNLSMVGVTFNGRRYLALLTTRYIEEKKSLYFVYQLKFFFSVSYKVCSTNNFMRTSNSLRHSEVKQN